MYLGNFLQLLDWVRKAFLYLRESTKTIGNVNRLGPTRCWFNTINYWFWPTTAFVGFLKKWANPGLFFVYFRSFQTNITIFTICEKCPSSIRCRDSNPWPLERESLPITTRPGLPPNSSQLFLWSTILSLYRLPARKFWPLCWNGEPLSRLFWADCYELFVQTWFDLIFWKKINMFIKKFFFR